MAVPSELADTILDESHTALLLTENRMNMDIYKYTFPHQPQLSGEQFQCARSEFSPHCMVYLAGQWSTAEDMTEVP